MTDLSLPYDQKADPSHRPTKAAGAGDYVALMKPRVMSLVVFTGLAGLVAAPGGVDPVLGAAMIFAIACGAGAAGALNQWYDADIDAKMSRTRMRPIPAGAVAKEEALALGLVVSALSVITMLLAANVLAAALLAFTIIFYAVVYTMWLKRATAQNIVIGGLAGALPPAIAWAGATNSLTVDPLILVAIIFFWTPPHFWALSLLRSQDYREAGVPMLPVTHGAAHTRLQILLYSIVMVPLGLAPAFTGLGGQIYTAAAAFMGTLFLVIAVRVARSRAGDAPDPTGLDLYAATASDQRAARDLFAFSILYLFVLFGALLAEHGLRLYAPIPWLSEWVGVGSGSGA
jgi:protoheme IX farnesyltransferase